MGDETAFWRQAANWLWALLIPVVWALWGTVNSRIRRMEENLEHKAPVTEMTRLWEAHRDIAVTMTMQDSENRKRFEALQVSMGRIEGKLDALINRPRD